MLRSFALISSVFVLSSCAVAPTGGGAPQPVLEIVVFRVKDAGAAEPLRAAAHAWVAGYPGFVRALLTQLATAPVVEIAGYTVKDGKLQDTVQPGLHQALRSMPVVVGNVPLKAVEGGGYVDLIGWQSKEAHVAVAAQMEKDPQGAAFMANTGEVKVFALFKVVGGATARWIAPVDTDHASPFVRDAAAEASDAQLAQATGRGDAAALEALIRRHQRWVYNLVLRFMLNPDDAADLAQEALVRVATRIAQFEARAGFRTWAYRIVFNCFMDARRGKLEGMIDSFDAYGESLDRIPLQALVLPREQEPDRRWLVQEAKIGCLLGMLLCLEREQRLVYLLGEIFEAPSPLAAAVLGLTAANFRKKLERARADLVGFMNDKCGLVRETNPCRCEKKTRGFIDAGWVDARRRRFVPLHYRQLKEHAAAHAPPLARLHEEVAAELFREQPLYEGANLSARLRALLDDPQARTGLRL